MTFIPGMELSRRCRLDARGLDAEFTGGAVFLPAAVNHRELTRAVVDCVHG